MVLKSWNQISVKIIEEVEVKYTFEYQKSFESLFLSIQYILQ